jgi:DNA modification methylase
MFPPQLARFIIEWLTSPGDTVYDPFSGRGTTPLEATLLSRRALASDANPLAVALTKPKTSIPAYNQVMSRLNTLRNEYFASDIEISSEPDDIRMLYSDSTLKQIVYLKSRLRLDHPVDALLVAVTLGMLHANHSAAGATAGFSISMPNTFAMSPGYVRRYIAEHGLVRPDVNVFSMIQSKVDRLGLGARPIAGGAAWRQDATATPPRSLKEKPAKLILTSPPYLQVIKYGKYNWIRLWFLGETPQSVDSVLMSSGSLSKYFSFMDTVLRRLRQVVADDGYLCLVIGDVRRNDRHLNLAQSVWDEVASPQGWHLHSIIEDHLPTKHKVSRIWKNNAGRATKVDRLLVISPNKTALPKPTALAWERPTLL